MRCAAMSAAVRATSRSSTPSSRSQGVCDERGWSSAAALRRAEARHGQTQLRRRRARPGHALGQGPALASRLGADRAHRHLAGRVKLPGRPRGRDPRRHAHEHRRSPGGPRGAGGRALLRRRRGALPRPADRRRGRRGRGDRARRGRPDRGASTRSASRSSTCAAPTTPGRRRSRPTATCSSTTRTIAARFARATSTQAYEQADVIVKGAYRPASIEQAPTETQVSLVVPQSDGRLHVYSCTQAMYFSMGVLATHLEHAARAAQVLRRHRRRRLRRQGRHGLGAARGAARAEGAAAGQVALDARGGDGLLLGARLLAHGGRRRADQGRLAAGPPGA